MTYLRKKKLVDDFIAKKILTDVDPALRHAVKEVVEELEKRVSQLSEDIALIYRSEQGG